MKNVQAQVLCVLVTLKRIKKWNKIKTMAKETPSTSGRHWEVGREDNSGWGNRYSAGVRSFAISRFSTFSHRRSETTLTRTHWQETVCIDSWWNGRPTLLQSNLRTAFGARRHQECGSQLFPLAIYWQSDPRGPRGRGPRALDTCNNILISFAQMLHSILIIFLCFPPRFVLRYNNTARVHNTMEYRDWAIFHSCS